MAEAKGGQKGGKRMFSSATKGIKRAHIMMLQKVGNAEKTTDPTYTEFVANFNRQQLAAARLQKELERYTQSIKALSQSTKSLTDLWLELYDQKWKGHDDVQNIIQQKMLLWEDILLKVQNDLKDPLERYMSKFPETKKIVEKRERKVAYFDHAKSDLESARQNRKITEAKLQLSEENYHGAKAAFDEVTDVLYEELPALFDSRIQFYSTFFQNMSSIEANFHSEMAKLDDSCTNIMTQLHEEAESGVHTSRKERVPDSDISLANLTPMKNSPPVDGEGSSVSDEDTRNSISSSVQEEESTTTGGGALENTTGGGALENTTGGGALENTTGGGASENTTGGGASENTTGGGALENTTGGGASENTTGGGASENTTGGGASEQTTPITLHHTNQVTKQDDDNEDNNSTAITAATVTSNDEPTVDQHENREEETSETEPSKPKDNGAPPPKPAKPPSISTDPRELEDASENTEDNNNKVDDTSTSREEETEPTPALQILYKVIAAHPYTGEDEDELNFDKGDIICVIPYENPDDEEDGWEMGFVEGTTIKGVFPKNFTKPYTE